MRIALVAGARPNFVKIAPLLRSLERHSEFSTSVVHTGQHYDDLMSAAFFRELEITDPDFNLAVGSGSHAAQTGRVMIAFDELLDEIAFDLVIVVGDVNSTLACSLVAVKRGVPVAHVEAGLRSNDWSMPEEINRVLTDAVSALLLTPSRDADENLIREGRSANDIYFVGNVMVDTLLRFREKTAERRGLMDRFGLRERGFALLTLHRPGNVDLPEVLREIMSAVVEISRDIPVIYPAHPRSRARMKRVGVADIIAGATNLQIIDPLPYLDFLALERWAGFVMTDSGGVQEETTVLGVPCLTLRDNTERPITITQGTNKLVGTARSAIVNAARTALSDHARPSAPLPELWDGSASERIASVLAGESERILNHAGSTSRPEETVQDYQE